MPRGMLYALGCTRYVLLLLGTYHIPLPPGMCHVQRTTWHMPLPPDMCHVPRTTYHIPHTTTTWHVSRTTYHYHIVPLLVSTTYHVTWTMWHYHLPRTWYVVVVRVTWHHVVHVPHTWSMLQHKLSRLRQVNLLWHWVLHKGKGSTAAHSTRRNGHGVHILEASCRPCVVDNLSGMSYFVLCVMYLFIKNWFEMVPWMYYLANFPTLFEGSLGAHEAGGSWQTPIFAYVRLNPVLLCSNVVTSFAWSKCSGLPV